tara:strand:+ start:35 stop:961 length:927 start_codon:yes stop_codon:yes gene_type:complete
MEKFDCENLIKGSLVYFKKLNITDSTWTSLMKNEKYSIELRNLLNGVRYIFSDEVNYKIKNCCINKKLINVFPTGSKHLHSDIDTQISIDISRIINPDKIESIIIFIIKILVDSSKLWKIKSIEKSLDINYYPPTLFNISSKKIKSHYILLNRDNTGMYKTVWIPQFTNDELYKNFFKEEMMKLENYKKKYDFTNTNDYYTKYNKYKINALVDLIRNIKIYKKNNIENDKKINNNILLLTKYSHIGAEMYFTYSSTLFVVWFLQMKNKVPISLIKKIAPIVAKEQIEMYKITKKKKYKERLEEVQKYL